MPSWNYIKAKTSLVIMNAINMHGLKTVAYEIIWVNKKSSELNNPSQHIKGKKTFLLNFTTRRGFYSACTRYGLVGKTCNFK